MTAVPADISSTASKLPEAPLLSNAEGRAGQILTIDRVIAHRHRGVQQTASVELDAATALSTATAGDTKDARICASSTTTPSFQSSAHPQRRAGEGNRSVYDCQQPRPQRTGQQYIFPREDPDMFTSAAEYALSHGQAIFVRVVCDKRNRCRPSLTHYSVVGEPWERSMECILASIFPNGNLHHQTSFSSSTRNETLCSNPGRDDAATCAHINDENDMNKLNHGYAFMSPREKMARVNEMQETQYYELLRHMCEFDAVGGLFLVRLYGQPIYLTCPVSQVMCTKVIKARDMQILWKPHVGAFDKRAISDARDAFAEWMSGPHTEVTLKRIDVSLSQNDGSSVPTVAATRNQTVCDKRQPTSPVNHAACRSDNASRKSFENASSPHKFDPTMKPSLNLMRPSDNESSVSFGQYQLLSASSRVSSAASPTRYRKTSLMNAACDILTSPSDSRPPSADASPTAASRDRAASPAVKAVQQCPSGNDMPATYNKDAATIPSMQFSDAGSCCTTFAHDVTAAVVTSNGEEGNHGVASSCSGYDGTAIATVSTKSKIHRSSQIAMSELDYGSSVEGCATGSMGGKEGALRVPIMYFHNFELNFSSDEHISINELLHTNSDFRYDEIYHNVFQVAKVHADGWSRNVDPKKDMAYSRLHSSQDGVSPHNGSSKKRTTAGAAVQPAMAATRIAQFVATDGTPILDPVSELVPLFNATLDGGQCLVLNLLNSRWAFGGSIGDTLDARARAFELVRRRRELLCEQKDRYNKLCQLLETLPGLKTQQHVLLFKFFDAKDTRIQSSVYMIHWWDTSTMGNTSGSNKISLHKKTLEAWLREVNVVEGMSSPNIGFVDDEFEQFDYVYKNCFGFCMPTFAVT